MQRESGTMSKRQVLLIRKHDLEPTGYTNIRSQLKIKTRNVNLQMKNYEIKREQFQQNRMFRASVSQFYKRLNGTGNKENISRDTDKATTF